MFVAMPRRHLLILLVAFAVSVAVRWPLLNRPLCGHHELCTALTLVALYNWRHDGFLHHHGAPAITFSGKADLIPPGYTDAPGLHDGVLYYLSHPPLAFDLPHALFSLTGTAPNAMGLQLFNLFFHLLTACALCLIVRELQPQGNAALFAALLYLFMPGPLWFHGNAYMSDMFVQNAWVWHVLIALRVLRCGSPISWRAATLCALTLFVTAIISWPGVWAGIALGAAAVWQWRRQNDGTRLRLLGAAMLGVGAALAYTAWRWLQVVDADALRAYFSGRFAERGTAGAQGSMDILAAIALNYRINWLPLALPLVIFSWRMRTIRSSTNDLLLFALLTTLPSLLEHAFLLQYTRHDFTTLKAGLLLCGLSGLGLATLRMRWSLAILAGCCIAGLSYFYRTNWFNAGSDERYFPEQSLGLSLAREADPDEMIFTIGFTPEPQVQWYAKRTLFRVDSLPQALELLRAQGSRRGLVIVDQGGMRTMERITVE